MAGNEKLRVKLSMAVNMWENNILSLLRKPLADSSFSYSFPAPGEIAANIENFTTAETALKDGNLVNMSDLYSAYDSIANENSIADKTCSR